MTGRSRTPAGGGGATDRRRVEALAVLGLPAGASPAQITQRFRELAKATHPDTSSFSASGDPRAVGPDMSRRMTAICDAYHLLTSGPAARDPSSAAVPGADTASAARPAGSQAGGRVSPAAGRGPVSVPVRRRAPRRAAETQPWIVAGPVRVQPRWPGAEQGSEEWRRRP